MNYRLATHHCTDKWRVSILSTASFSIFRLTWRQRNHCCRCSLRKNGSMKLRKLGASPQLTGQQSYVDYSRRQFDKSQKTRAVQALWWTHWCQATSVPKSLTWRRQPTPVTVVWRNENIQFISAEMITHHHLTLPISSMTGQYHQTKRECLQCLRH